MSDYVQTELTPTYEMGRKDGRIVAACVCGNGINVPDKGLGRAAVAAWKTRHQDCEATR